MNYLLFQTFLSPPIPKWLIRHSFKQSPPGVVDSREVTDGKRNSPTPRWSDWLHVHPDHSSTKTLVWTTADSILAEAPSSLLCWFLKTPLFVISKSPFWSAASSKGKSSLRRELNPSTSRTWMTLIVFGRSRRVMMVCLQLSRTLTQFTDIDSVSNSCHQHCLRFPSGLCSCFDSRPRRP